MVHFTPKAPHPIQAATVPLFHTYNQGHLIQDRSAVLLSLGHSKLLITAEHDIHLGSRRQLYTSGIDLVFHERKARESETIKLDIMDAVHEEAADFTVLKLGSRCVTELTSAGKHFLTVDEVRSITEYREEQFVMLGHPFFLTQNINVGRPNGRTSSPLCWFDTSPVMIEHRPTDNSARDKLFLNGPVDVTMPNGTRIPSDELQGFSGCGMWLMLGDHPKLAGIFNWYMRKANSARIRWVRGVRLAPVLQTIQTKWPRTKNDVRNVLTYP